MTTPCAACAQLAGEPSSTAPHPRLTLERADALLERDSAAGAVERWRCATCGSLMLRFLRGPIVPSASGVGSAAWRIVPPPAPPAGGGTGGTG